MNDKELADAIVALLYKFFDWGDKPSQAPERYGASEWPVPKVAHDFVRDWRVAGALMEEVDITKLDWDLIGLRAIVIDSLPRAIIENCVEALK